MFNKSSNFGSFPSWFATSKIMKERESGLGIAMLKCLLALSVLVDNKTFETIKTLDFLEDITGLSRPYVIKGCEKLRELKLIDIDKSNKTNKYILLRDNDNSGWVKTPKTAIIKNLKNIPNRGVVIYIALKIYITLLAVKNNSSYTSTISHAKIVSRIGCQPNKVRSGLDILYNHSFIHVELNERRDSNVYTFR